MKCHFCRLHLRSLVLLMALLMSGLLFPNTSHAHGNSVPDVQLDLGMSGADTQSTEVAKHCGFGPMCIVIADVEKRHYFKIKATSFLRQLPGQYEHSHIFDLGVDIPPPRHLS